MNTNYEIQFQSDPAVLSTDLRTKTKKSYAKSIKALIIQILWKNKAKVPRRKMLMQVSQGLFQVLSN